MSSAPPVHPLLAPTAASSAAAPAVAPNPRIGAAPAFAMLVSNMVGTGVFTALGFQVLTVTSGFALLALWVIGGVLSLTGALAYAELGAALPHSGGEFVYLRRAWAPWVGFLGGWVSMTAGFAAPIALAGIAFGRYVAALVPVTAYQASLAILVFVALVHWSALHIARRFQVIATSVTIALIAGFIVWGLLAGPSEPIGFAPSAAAWREISSAPFAVSLIYVIFAYTGWNSIGYIAGDVQRPAELIPRTVTASIAVVSTLYVLLNWVFLRTVPLELLGGTVEVGALSASRIGGAAGGRWMSGVIAMTLVATISGLTMAGSRVTQAVCAGTPRLARLGVESPTGVPRAALALQFALVALLILTGAFETVLAYTGFVLNLSSLVTVVGLMRLRRTEPDLPRPFRVPWYPLTPLLFVGLSCWMLVFVLMQRPLVLAATALTLLTGAAVYRLTGARSSRL